MNIDWGIVATIASPLVALVVGGVLTLMLSRPVVTTYLGHASAHRADAVAGGKRLDVFTHSLVIQNTGWISASNVKLAHSKLPSFSVYPDVEYRVSDLPGGGQEILFPSLVPNEQITVSYLYFPPVTWDQINLGVKSDEGFAKVIRVIPMRLYPKWLNKLAAVFVLAGAISVLYAFLVLVGEILSRFVDPRLA